MAKNWNIFGKLSGEISDFDSQGIYIVGKPENIKYESKDRRGERGGYYHSQRDLLMSIDLACASKYKQGIWDDEGQRKTYLNIVNFFRDVMKMKININVANYILEPRSRVYTWVVWLFDRIFKLWAAMYDYDDKIDEFAHDLSTYGTCVSKKAGDCPHRVPLRTIRNTQSAKSLYHAAANGGYVILENTFHFNEMEEYPDWTTDDLDPTESYEVFERYALVPEGLIKTWRNMTDLEISQYSMAKEERLKLAVAVIVLEGCGKVGKGEGLLYLEALTDDTWPLDECHVEKVDGRWIGRGEVEKQLENQISRNLNANYRRRGILWAARKIFQSTDESVQKNLVSEVFDGEVIHIKKEGQITQVNTGNQHTGEIANDDAAWKESSEKNSFAFEVATGESMPSGTPFRLGVVLSQAVSSHFQLVRETFSNFLKRCFFNQIIPTCKAEYDDEHEAIVALAGPEVDSFREEIIVYHTNMRIWDRMIGGKKPDGVTVRGEVEEELAKNAYAFITVPKKFYEHAEFYMKLNLVEDISADIADLTTLYQALVQKGDPRSENVLAEIFAKRGKALPAIAGPKPPMQPAPEAEIKPAAPARAAAPVA